MLDARIARLHTGHRLRVWSIVVTVFGDAVMPRGGTIAATALQEITARLRVEPGAMRVALSRLVGDGWLVRRRIGRRSFYRLTEDSANQVMAASRRIYAPEPAPTDDRCEVAVIENGTPGRRDRQHDALVSAGFVPIDGGAYVRSQGSATPPLDHPTDEVFILEGSLGRIPAWVRTKLSPPEIAAAYETLIDDYTPLAVTLSNETSLSPHDAMTARTLLIHDWRRVLLRDHDLPATFRADGWPGARAGRLVRALYARLLPASERWLDSCAGGEKGELPPADRSLLERFGGAAR